MVVRSQTPTIQSMANFIIKTLVAAFIISLCSWLSGKKPILAGFIVALPLTTLIVLLFSYVEHGNPENSVQLAKSIFVGVPVSLVFFIPFLLANRLQLNFWTCYMIGIGLLVLGFFIHRYIMSLL